MILKSAYIENFRNIKELKINFSKLTVIVGENNIGKTTVLKAINKILKMGESPHRVRFSEEDFYLDTETNERSQKIVIELTFSGLCESEKSAFVWAGINLDNDEIAVRLEAKWEELNNDASVEICFIRTDDLDDEKGEQISLADKKYIPFYYIDAYRNLWKEVNSSKGDLKQIFKEYNKHYLKPLNEQFTQATKNIDEYLTDYSKSENPGIITALEEINDVLSSSSSDLSDKETLLRTNISGIKEDIKTLTPQDEGLLNKILNILISIYHKIGIQLSIEKLQLKVNNLDEITKIKANLQENLSIFVPNNDISVELGKIDESTLFDENNICVEDISIFNQGSGFQGSFVIALKLSRLFTQLMFSDESAKSLIVGIEEPEAHMHPHLQRSFIKKLKMRQNKLHDDGYTVQIIITTHSPSILSRIDKSEIILLKRESDGICKSISFDTNFIEEVKRDTSPEQIKHFDYIFRMYPEVFLSRGVIIVEGKTEFGALPEFAKTIDDVDLDELGLSIINAEGKDAIKPLYIILNKFIKCVAIRDNEGTNSDEDLIADLNEAYYKTSYKDYEEELIHSVDPLKLVKILIEMNTKPDNFYLHRIYMHIPKTRGLSREQVLECWDSIDFNHFLEEMNDSIEDEFLKSLKEDYKTSLSASILSSKLNEDEIPSCYKNVLLKAKELVLNNER
ncbi:MAG: putative ATP-dependent endonuclease of the family [Methanolobus sp.]|uniref:ATP-dependent nuclease n=1 Tax=Methanolobus sp. TaxID=1874737 RepID=UPI00258CFA8D|nr:AAA family ATPase [Methanolobus sp.]MDK2831392.1 putative ATP-dependent endonuclease of the family [Methanolobus sp.]